MAFGVFAILRPPCKAEDRFVRQQIVRCLGCDHRTSGRSEKHDDDGDSDDEDSVNVYSSGAGGDHKAAAGVRSRGARSWPDRGLRQFERSAAWADCELAHSVHAKKCGKRNLYSAESGRGSIMPAIFDLLYREYCRARLAEMRKQLSLLWPGNHELPEANCDADRPADRADVLADVPREPATARRVERPEE